MILRRTWQCCVAFALFALMGDTGLAQEPAAPREFLPFVLVDVGGSCVTVCLDNLNYPRPKGWKPKESIPYPGDLGPTGRHGEGNTDKPERQHDFSRLEEKVRRHSPKGAAGAPPAFPEGKGKTLVGIPEVKAQMYDQWLGVGTEHLYEMDMRGMTKESRLGAILKAAYSPPPMGIQRPQTPATADLVKPFLFQVRGRYYSVYGDAQLAGHVPVKTHPTQLAALRYAGNLLYAVSEELPPGLQSCGVDANGVIWIADAEGHVAFFKTNIREFIQEIATIGGSPRLRIPRRNLSSSLFASSDEQKGFREYEVDVQDAPVLTQGARSLPSDVVQVLHCDSRRLVYVTDDAVTLLSSDGEAGASTRLGLAEDEHVMEGVYIPSSQTVSILVAPKPRYEDDVRSVRKTWSEMRLVRVALPD